MKRKIRFFIISYFIFLCLGIISCEDDDCGPFPDKFKISSLNWELFQIENLNASYTFSEIENNAVSYKNFSIKVNAEINTYYSSSNTRLLKNSFITSTYACSPAEPTSDEKITNIEIIANKDFNVSNKAGENISHLFDVLVVSYGDNYYYEKFDLKEFINSKPTVVNELIFILKEAPENTSDFEFEINYYQDGIDLNNYSFVTNEIEIRNY